jgi:hypothetical protein
MKLKQLSVIEPSRSFVSIKKRVDVISGRRGFDSVGVGIWFWFGMINADFGRELFKLVHSAFSGCVREIE